MLHMIPNATPLHRLHKPEFIPPPQIRLIKVIIGTSDPYLIALWLIDSFDIKHDQFLWQASLDTNLVVRIARLIIDKYVVLWMVRADLMPEDFAAPTCLIDLDIVKASKLIKGYLSISVEYQNRQQ